MRKSLFLMIPLWLASTFFGIWPIHADWAYHFVEEMGIPILTVLTVQNLKGGCLIRVSI